MGTLLRMASAFPDLKPCSDLSGIFGTERKVINFLEKIAVPFLSLPSGRYFSMTSLQQALLLILQPGGCGFAAPNTVDVLKKRYMRIPRKVTKEDYESLQETATPWLAEFVSAVFSNKNLEEALDQIVKRRKLASSKIVKKMVKDIAEM